MTTQFFAKENAITFNITSKLYPIDIILNTAYIFVDRCYVFLDGDPASVVKINLKGKNKLSDKQLLDLSGEFNNELLNQILRAKLAKDNKKLREYIVGQALIGASPEQPAADSGQNTDEELDRILERELKALEKEEKKESASKSDPMGILKPWKKDKIKAKRKK
ncbi:His-Xaa-Ser system protein HxsD [Candidatus Roizmanbacteria bacterium RIFCSPHIGHO2_02_FULL_37_24]|uniref:His-Xaa-Ser system protein HxsD n=1 Tax=Candidatus Roizmanbacteria bacterium RIFCSPHIGHO2_02_FULL_37_24 TaxID=1802037 RepID=A0A1F7GV05_9BACT|nr:MAG: His-Xaa-Ser system protein HxsD [Candidatus Roizmanbacteria bacterium RIFCSPHIGHO2_02_FULL_37_24]HLD62036.1 His-Xaa-Ser system protein HxsD [Patescibacteria group bacterium]